ncbi:DoxX family protein [uncultured Polaribacter sp.]|uniref:DoxX family protein n=1 Tax=uncultured Polaribacter sp. TaxID=174711 RepID=UPI0030D97846|tara:strand:- start:569 stop:967 length:399 start_codon:yes stop_codon:yes gene_type:complete
MKLLSNYPAEILILLFLVITFLISVVEKIIDWKGTVSFIKEHFKNSPLKNYVSFLVSILVILEFIATIFMIIGIYQIYTSEIKEFALIGLELSAIVLIFMLIGQRLAKDYPGAMSLTVYFILTVFGVFLLNS